MLAISNSNYATPGGMLETWLDGVKRANVTNAMVVALDRETKDHAEKLGVPAHLMTLQVQISPATPCDIALAGTTSPLLNMCRHPSSTDTSRLVFPR